MPTSLIISGVVVILVVVITAFAMTPKARAGRAAARKHRREMAELRSRVGASARATYRKQFPRRTGSSGGSSGDVTISHFAGDGGGDGGGGD